MDKLDTIFYVDTYARIPVVILTLVYIWNNKTQCSVKNPNLLASIEYIGYVIFALSLMYVYTQNKFLVFGSTLLFIVFLVLLLVYLFMNSSSCTKTSDETVNKGLEVALKVIALLYVSYLLLGGFLVSFLSFLRSDRQGVK